MQDVITIGAILALILGSIAAIRMTAITRHHMNMTASYQRMHGHVPAAAHPTGQDDPQLGLTAAPTGKSPRPAVTMVRLVTVAATMSAGIWADVKFGWHEPGMIAVAVIAVVAWAFIARVTRRRAAR